MGGVCLHLRSDFTLPFALRACLRPDLPERSVIGYRRAMGYLSTIQNAVSAMQVALNSRTLRSPTGLSLTLSVEKKLQLDIESNEKFRLRGEEYLTVGEGLTFLTTPFGQLEVRPRSMEYPESEFGEIHVEIVESEGPSSTRRTFYTWAFYWKTGETLAGLVNGNGGISAHMAKRRARWRRAARTEESATHSTGMSNEAFSRMMQTRRDPSSRPTEAEDGLGSFENDLDLATGASLDMIGMLWGAVRGGGDTDSDYRERIRASALALMPHLNSAGGKLDPNATWFPRVHTGTWIDGPHKPEPLTLEAF